MASCYYNASKLQNNSYYGYEFILDGIVERINKYLEEKKVKLTSEEAKQIYEFLAPLVDGRVWVNCDTMPDENEGYCKISIPLSVHTLHLAFEVNCSEGKFSNQLYVSVEEDYEKKFIAFWEKHYLPTCLLEDSMKLINYSKGIFVHVYESAYHFRIAIEAAKNPIVFGQDINSKDFKSFRPAAFVDGNLLVILSPNEKTDAMGITYNYN